ncbi:hypothetical protein DL98DRAFT_143438 [Cadophora sp. DSE1049]|nr:hypothetical protein DL98DRAFT_143438 [Cadophora sp. DSE1049]
MAAPTPNPILNPNGSSPVDSEQRIRNICHHGFHTYKQMQEALDTEFHPHADQILAMPNTNQFSERAPSKSVVFWALSRECYPLLRYLIRNGWDLNSMGNSTGYCPSLLGERCVLSNTELTRFLLDQGMDPTIGIIPRPNPLMPTKDSKGNLLYSASRFSNLETFKLLQSRGANLTYAHALHGAACSGPSQIPIIRHLLETKAVDVDELEIYHVPQTGTPLLAAIQKGSVELVKIFLEYGAHPLACITIPYETNAEKMAEGLGLENEDASKEMLKMLEDARKKREREGMLGDVPVTDMGRTDWLKMRTQRAQRASGT